MSLSPSFKKLLELLNSPLAVPTQRQTVAYRHDLAASPLGSTHTCLRVSPTLHNTRHSVNASAVTPVLFYGYNSFNYGSINTSSTSQKRPTTRETTLAKRTPCGTRWSRPLHPFPAAAANHLRCSYLAGGTSMLEETTFRFCSRRQMDRVFSFSWSRIRLAFLVSAALTSSSMASGNKW